MIFKILNKEEYASFSINHPYFTFYQSYEQIKVKSLTDWQGEMVGVLEDEKIIGATVLLRKKLPYVNKYLYYAPRGLLIDYDNQELINFFTKELKKHLKRNHGFILIIDPYVFNKERDKEGKVIEGGYDNSRYVNNLINAGFKHTGFNLGFENLQTRWISIINTENKTYEEIEKNFSKAKRKQAKQLYLYGIYTKEMKTIDEIKVFNELESEVGKRKGFLTRSSEYYENMFDAFYPKLMTIAETRMNFKDAIFRTQEAIDSILKERKDIEDKLNNKKISLNMDRYKAKCLEEDKLIENYQESIKTFKECLNKYGEETTISAHQYMLSKDEIICLASGNKAELVRYHGDISAYIWGIKYALEHKMKRFNMYGISGDLSKDSPMYGVYALKKEFGGVVVDLIGEFHLIISPFWTLAYKIAKKIMVKELK